MFKKIKTHKENINVSQLCNKVLLVYFIVTMNNCNFEYLFKDE